MKRIIYQQKPWNEIAKQHIGKIGSNQLVLSMTFENTSDLSVLPTIPKFYQEVILAFSKYKGTDRINTKQQLFDQIIWGNRYFTYNRKCLYSKSLVEINIIYLSDILLENGKIRENIYHQLKNKTTYFKDITELYTGLIPFKHIRFSNFRIDRNIVVDPVIYVQKHSKSYYTALRNKKQLPPVSINFWKREFPDFSFKTVFQNKIRKQYISTIKQFLFKIYHNICACNDKLFKWKVSKTKRCIYCNNASHTVKHMLWECAEVQEIWVKLNNFREDQITYRLLIIGDKNIILNNLISFLMFSIYKKFIIDNNYPVGPYISCSMFIKHELIEKSEVYEKMENISINISQKMKDLAMLL